MLLKFLAGEKIMGGSKFEFPTSKTWDHNHSNILSNVKSFLLLLQYLWM